MATFSRTLETTLRRALALANDHRHEYVTLEHLLLSLIDDEDAAGVMTACKVDLERLRASLEAYLDDELDNLIVDGRDGEDARPTAGFQRVLQRAMLHVDSSSAKSAAPTCLSRCSPNAKATPRISCRSRTCRATTRSISSATAWPKSRATVNRVRRAAPVRAKKKGATPSKAMKRSPLIA
jgi:ATP-dependent Clp protease ATP-binding subunit ClpA